MWFLLDLIFFASYKICFALEKLFFFFFFEFPMIHDSFFGACVIFRLVFDLVWLHMKICSYLFFWVCAFAKLVDPDFLLRIEMEEMCMGKSLQWGWLISGLLFIFTFWSFIFNPFHRRMALLWNPMDSTNWNNGTLISFTVFQFLFPCCICYLTCTCSAISVINFLMNVEIYGSFF